MQSLTWSSSFETRIAEIDAQNRQLFADLNERFLSGAKCNDGARICWKVDHTVSQLKSNFANEELLMRQLNYPSLASHRGQHKFLLTKLNRIEAAVRCGGYEPAHLFNLLSMWITNHILSFDKRFGDFAIGSGTATSSVMTAR